jgi:hypothetical protein
MNKIQLKRRYENNKNIDRKDNDNEKNRGLKKEIRIGI